MTEGPVNEQDLPEGAQIEYCVAYTDHGTITMDGPREVHMNVWNNTLEGARKVLAYVERTHPDSDARIQSRIVYPWQDVR